MDPLFIILLTLIASGLGAYLGSYLKKKDENLATHEDIDKLLAQVTAVTQATKQIEATISVDVWDRQKKWEIKRDAFFEVVKELASMENTLYHPDSAFQAAKRTPESASWMQKKEEAIERLTNGSLSFKKAYELATLVCDQEVRKAFDSVNRSIIRLAKEALADKPSAVVEAKSDLIPTIQNLKAAIRRELGIPVTPEEGQQ